MQCSTCRELLSARLDGELTEIEDEAVTAHLTTCAACRDHAGALADLHRLTRVRPAEPVPDLAARILGNQPVAARRGRPRRRSPGLVPALRAAIGFVALVQIGLALPEVIGHDSLAAIHASHHLGGWDLAFAAGLLVVAAQPWRVRGLLPMAAALAGLMVALSIVDLTQGRAPLMAEASHAVELLGVALLWLLARAVGSDAPAPAGTLGPRRTAWPSIGRSRAASAGRWTAPGTTSASVSAPATTAERRHAA